MSQKRRSWRTLRASRLAATIACAGLLVWPPTAGAADDDDARVRELTQQSSWIELGAIYSDVDRQAYPFGKYTGLVDDEFHVLGNIDVHRRAPWDSADSWYYRLRGLNLGLDSRSINAEYGQQGRFALSFLYDEIPAYKTDTAQTFFNGVGTSALTLPAGWVAGGRADTPVPGDVGFPTAFQTSIQTNLYRSPVDSTRRRYGGGVKWVLPAELEFESNYVYETKQGTKLLGSTFGTGGGNPRSVILPERMDYQTHTFDSALRYAGDDLQLEVAYLLSQFGNDHLGQSWMNPYTAPDGWDPAAAFQGPPDGVVAECVGVPACGTGRRSQPPDNVFHEIIASAGYSLPHRTRVTLSTAFSWMQQDDDFLPYSVNPALAATTQGGLATQANDLAALPRLSLDGEIFTSIVDFGVASRPIDKLSLNAGYRFENRDNDTPRSVYIYIPSDTVDQASGPTALESSQARVNMPYSLRKHELSFDAGYELPGRTKLTATYDWEQVERDYQEVKELREHTLGAILNTRPTSWLNARLTYRHAWRDGSRYDGSLPLREGHTPEHIAHEIAEIIAAGACAAQGLQPSECLFENHPLLRKYYLADRSMDSLSALLAFQPREDLGIALNLGWRDEDYDDTILGLTGARQVSPGIDVTYAPFERVHLYAYYSYDDLESKQAGLSFTPTLSTALDPTRGWTSRERVRTHTTGAGVAFDAIPRKLELGADYLYAHSAAGIDTAVGPELGTPQPFPDAVTKQHDVSLHAEYRFTENLSARVGYLYARLDTRDWAYDGLSPTSLECSSRACVIGTGQEAPNQTFHVGALSIVYRFW